MTTSSTPRSRPIGSHVDPLPWHEWKGYSPEGEDGVDLHPDDNAQSARMIKIKPIPAIGPCYTHHQLSQYSGVDLTDCFAWDYTEMPGLDRSIIEHRLPLKKGFRPFQQRARQMKAEILEEVKKEIEKMLAAGFIRPCRYAEWISSIVPVEKKDGRWRVAIDFRDLNRATPKDDDMFYRTLEGLLLKCLGPTESNRLLHEVHEGACGTHQSAHKMKWLIRRSGFYWPTMLEDCFNYYKGCQACQMFGKIQMVPASAMNPIIKPWPFRGWGMDMIGKIHPASSKKHEWILAITDYFTKWVEAVPMKKVKSEDVIKFVKEHVIHRFGIPQTITTDGGSVFVSKEFRGFCDDMGIKLIRSSPYYAQANGQAEASNQSLIKLIKRKIEENPRDWHEKLSEALWAYRMSCHGAIKTSPYQLVYGQEAVLPWEITAGSRRVTFQDDLTADEYAALMSDTIEDATELRLWSLEKIKENKARVARAYNKKVRPKEFQVGDLVWEAVLPLGTRDKAYGKWSPNWHGPYKVVQALKGNAYMLEELDGQKFPVAVNGQHLKKYFPSMWDDGH
ncbi:hypothetical protein QYE76_029492 [Lolium multiflorum]|uniref:Integrase catalytic domain-containing protein n=1 Tax=Lolium multiflorum TaxID=4521 RepID=A0AAD8QR91_LOLMU|nr:hypothetical protein QYE76_029492 [Lolium multiflorum]